jgi:hypothetical protein
MREPTYALEVPLPDHLDSRNWPSLCIERRDLRHLSDRRESAHDVQLGYILGDAGRRSRERCARRE